MKQPIRSVTRLLSQKEVPDGSIIAVLSDVHIPHHDERAVRLVVECCEDAGVTHVLLNGDIADCGPSSRHGDKQAEAVFDEGDLKESIAPGYWIYEWARTRPCIYILGNHEAWVQKTINKSATMRGSSAVGMMGLWEDNDGWEVLPNLSRVCLGNQTWEHGNSFFPRGFPKNPGPKIKDSVPDRSTSIGHGHQVFLYTWTTRDEHGNERVRSARGNGHLSLTESHEEYAAYPSWQQSFELSYVYHVDGQTRLTVEQPLIHRDKRNRPYFHYAGKTYQYR